MKIRDYYALMVFALMAAVIMLSSCGNGECAAGASMPSSMAKLGIPAVEGASVCKSSEKFVSFLNHDREAGQLLMAYTDHLRRSGWMPSGKQSTQPGYESYEKGNNKLMITVKRCGSPGISEYFGTCSIVEVWDDTD